MSPSPWYHFAGVGGSGMSALAQFHVMTGGRASGSDRAFDQGKSEEIRRHLEALGVRIAPQDGSGLERSPEAAGIAHCAGKANGDTAADETASGTAPFPRCDALVVSTAVEETVPDVRAARRGGIPILHRAELLARFVQERRTVAVTGTSGKSTVVAMIFELLRGAGRDPSVITGGDLLLLQEQGYLGNAWVGGTDLLIIEADESDGSLIRYEPWLGVLLNLQRDHKEPEELAEIFQTFRRRVRGPFVLGEDANLDSFARALIPAEAEDTSLEVPGLRGGESAEAVRFGLGPACSVRAEAVRLGSQGSQFVIGEVDFELPIPGLHNVRNATAAAAACLCCGMTLGEMTGPLRTFRGVGRRFQVIGQTRGVEVIDDFAHNPSKIAASLATARPRGRRILAIFQPHGFGPTRFLRDQLIEAFAEGLTAQDKLYMPEIFYAGGTATRDISSRDIVGAVAARGIPAHFAESRGELVEVVAAEARAGDVILVMGARDPSLTEFCRAILRRLAEA